LRFFAESPPTRSCIITAEIDKDLQAAFAEFAESASDLKK